VKLHIPSRLLERFKLHQQTRILIIAIVIGILSGLLNVGFRYFVEGFGTTMRSLWAQVWGIDTQRLDELLAGGSILVTRFDTDYLLLPLFPLTGALLIWLLWRFFPGFEGGYTFPNFLVAVNLRGGIIRLRATLVRALGAAITIGSGGSAGLEAPVASLGGAAGSAMGRTVQASGSRMRLFVACGVAAAIASNFNAPITGVLFAFEIVLLANYQLTSFGAIVISSGVGTVISRWAFGDTSVFHTPLFELLHYWELGLYALLGIVCGLLGGLFIHFFYWVKGRFDRIPGRELPKLLFGGLAVGAIAIAFPQVMGAGYNVIQASLAAAYTPLFVAGIFLAKAIATSITLGSGMVGGMFGPPLVLGTMVGAGFAGLVRTLTTIPISTAPFAVVGMGAFLAAVTRAPLTSMFLLFELTGSYEVVVPAMFATIVAVVVSRRVSRHSIDGVQLHKMGVHFEEGHDTGILSSLQVRDVMQPGFTVINHRTPFRELAKLFTRTQETYFPVVDDDGRMQGILSFQDVRSVLFEETLANVLVAGELATSDVITLVPTDTLQLALQRFNLKDIDSIPVVDNQDPRKVLGMLRRKDVLDAYNRELLRRDVTQF
jgi:chloride channel protein, CIC family